jgi:hypothetical protein
MVGDHEWWHWGTAIVPRKGVYGYINPVDAYQDGSVTLHINLGTNNTDESFFEQLLLRSKMPGADPLTISGWMKTIPNQEARIGLVSSTRLNITGGVEDREAKPYRPRGRLTYPLRF